MANTISTDRTSYPIGSNVLVAYNADVDAYIGIYLGSELFDSINAPTGSGTVQFPTPSQGWVYNPGTYTARLKRYASPNDTLAEVSFTIESLEPPPDTLGCYLGNGVWVIDDCNAEIMTDGRRGVQLTSVPGNVDYTVYILRTRSNCGFVSGEVVSLKYYSNGLWYLWSSYDPVDSNGYNYVYFSIPANSFRYLRIEWADCTKQWEQTSPLCTPNWKCEQPLNGYEYDGCGNRRLNPSCNSTPPPTSRTLTINNLDIASGSYVKVSINDVFVNDTRYLSIYNYNDNDKITVEAVTAPDWRFVRWTVPFYPYYPSFNPYSFNAVGDITISADFIPVVCAKEGEYEWWAYPAYPTYPEYGTKECCPGLVREYDPLNFANKCVASITVSSVLFLRNGVADFDCTATSSDNISFTASVTGLITGQRYKCEWKVKKDTDPETSFFSDLTTASLLTTFNSIWNAPVTVAGSYTITYVVIYNELNIPVWTGVP